MANTIINNNYDYRKKHTKHNISENDSIKNHQNNHGKNNQNSSNFLNDYNIQQAKRNLIPQNTINEGKAKKVENLLESVGDTAVTNTTSTVTQSAGKTGRNVRQVYVINKTMFDLSVGTVMNASTRYQNRKKISDFKSELVKREAKSILEKGGTNQQVRDVSNIILKKKFNIIEQDELKQINAILKRNNLNPLKSKGKQLQKVATNNLRAKKNKYNKEVIEALKRAQKLGQAGIYNNVLPPVISIKNIKIQKRKVTNLTIMQMAKYGGETGQGLYTTYSIAEKSKMLLKASYNVIKKITRAGRTIVKQAVLRNNLSKLKKLQKKKTEIMQLKNKHVDTTKLEKKVNKLQEKQINKRNKRNKKRNKKKLKDKVKDKINGITNKITSKISSKFANSFIGKVSNIGKKVANKIMNVLTKPFAILKAALNTLKKYLLIGIGLIIVVYFALLLIIDGLVAVLSIFDVSKASKKEIVTDYLQTLYISDLKYMVYVRDGYYINFKDIRNQEAYNKNLTDNNENTDNNTEDESTNIEYWTQSTNGAEILSMAYVYYDYGFEDEDVEDIKDYVEGLYYGSHHITRDDTLYNYTFETIYYDQLFTVEEGTGVVIDSSFKSQEWYEGFAGEEMLHSPETVIEHNIGQLSENEKLTYDTLKNLGYSDMAVCAIMGNIYEKSNFDPTIDDGAALGIFQFDYATGTADAYKSWCDASGLDYYTIENQCQYICTLLENEFNTYTGGEYIYTHNRRNPVDGSYEASHKDTTYYHVWVMEEYTLDNFKSWDEDSYLASELTNDYMTHGDTNIGNGEAVTTYINSLSDKDKSVLYATLLFTRTHERPNTGGGNYCGYLNDWISKKCMKAIEYYHKVVGFEGETVPYYQGYYQDNFDNVDTGACVSSSFAMACASVGIKGESGYIYNVSDTYDPTYGMHRNIYPNAYNNSCFYWGNGKNLLNINGAIELEKDEENDTSIEGIKYRYFTTDMTKEYLEAELLAGHYVMLRVGTTQTQYASQNHTVLAVGIEDGNIIIADPGLPDTSPSSWDEDELEEIKSLSITDSNGNPLYSPCKRVVADDWAFGNLEGYDNYYYAGDELVTGSTYSTFIIWKD